MHTHGDGLIHIHPLRHRARPARTRPSASTSSTAGGARTTTRFKLWDGTEHKTGDKCDGKEATVRWEVNGEPQSGDISNYQPENGDVIALAFLPEGEEIGDAAVGVRARGAERPRNRVGATTDRRRPDDDARTTPTTVPR